MFFFSSLLLLLLWVIFLLFVVPIQSKQTGGFGFWTDDLIIMDVEERHTSLLPRRSCFTLFVVQAQWWVRIFVGLKRHNLKSDARVVVVGNAVNNMMLLSALLFIIVAGIEHINTSNIIPRIWCFFTKRVLIGGGRWLLLAANLRVVPMPVPVPALRLSASWSRSIPISCRKASSSLARSSIFPRISTNSCFKVSAISWTLYYYVPTTIIALQLERHDPFVVYDHCFPLK